MGKRVSGRIPDNAVTEMDGRPITKADPVPRGMKRHIRMGEGVQIVYHVPVSVASQQRADDIALIRQFQLGERPQGSTIDDVLRAVVRLSNLG